MASIFDKVWRWVWNTETKYYDGEITRDTDWGGDESTENQPVSGGRVQEWLKNEINGKFGVARMSQLDPDTNFYSIELFVSKEEEKRYDEADDKDAVKDLVTRLTIPISAVQGDSYSARLYADIEQNNIVVSGSDFKVPFRFSSIRYSQGVAEDAGARGTLYIQVSTDNGSTWSDVATLRNELQSRPSTNTDFNKDDVLNIGGYLKDGRQLVRVRASFEYEDIATGDLRTAYSSWVTIGASVTKTNLELKLITEYHIPMSPTDVNGNVQNFNVTYQVNGAAQKTLFVKVDGGSEVKYDYDPTVNGSNQTIEISGNQYLTHGVHKVEAWLECNDGLGGKITSEKLVNRFMMVADKSDTTPYLLLQNVDGWIDNFVQTEICEYAVYAPDKTTPIDVAFLLTNYGNDYEYFRLEASVIPQTANKLLTTVEIEAENDAQQQDTYQTYFRVNRKDGDAWVDFMHDSTGETNYVVYVDNTNAMTPVTGATFLLNPKVRNNNEANPLQILNAKNNNAVVDSEWTNADLINGMWTTDDAGNKVLRIMAGTKLEIKKDVWAQFRENPASSLTFEIDCKISNVTNTTDPIIQMFSGTASSFRGLKMNALEGWLRNGTEQNADDTLFAWDEDVRTHFSFNLHHQVQPNKGDVKFPQGDADKAKGTIALARVMVNGDIVRELKYDTSKTDEWTTSNTGSIIIGNEGADIDIYSIRIYEKKQIEAKDILMRNFLATLPKAEDKVALKAKNNIMDGDRIGLENAKNAKLNCMVWHGALPYFYDQDDRAGWMEIWRYDEKGNYLPDLSGTICKATKLLAGKGQGSTAKTYYDWNLQDDSSKVKYNFAEQRGTILVALKDIHESIVVGAPYEGTIDEDKDKGGQYSGLVVDVYGGNLGKNFPLENKAKAYPYVNGSVMFPDGWIDGNGKYRGMGYMVAYGTALAQKRVIKINYASSMQSHLIGACKTYDLLHRKVVGDTPLQERVPTAVSAKHTEPFMFFNEDGNGTFFKGMGTYGAGKADKVAWAFVKKEMPMYALIEGSDNNLPMTGFRVPFDKNTAVYDCNGEGWLYNGIQSFDFDLGCTEHFSDATQQGEGWKFVNTDTNDGEVPSKAIRDKWADIHNFIYLHSTNLRFFDGTFDQFKNSSAAKDTNYKYWCTQGSEAFYLKRYDHIGGQWVNAGLSVARTNYDYYVLNLSVAQETEAAYAQWETTGNGDYELLNDLFKQSMVDSMKKYLKYFINEKSLQFNYCYVLGFLAGTDNSDKNTYYKIMPYALDIEKDSKFSSWYEGRFNKAINTFFVHQLYFDGDDMDSILRTNNNAHLTKPYYLDRMHPYADEKPNEPLYEGLQNQLFNFVEKAYEGTHELSSVMNQIMIAATELITEEDTKNGLVGGKSLWGFLNKYFFNVQRYFPQIAYIEQARIRYEFPELLGFISSGGGARSIRPITQSLGSQLQAEFQYMKQRVIYMTSYAGFGAWSGATQSIGLDDANDTFNFMPDFMPDGSTSTYTFTIQTHQYLYPSSFNGQTHTLTHQRVKPNTPFTFTIAKDMGKSDTGIGIHGINYISDLGRLTDKSITTKLIINGKRLKIINSGFVAGTVLRASEIVVTAKNIAHFVIYNTFNISTLDLSSLIRLKFVELDSVFYTALLPKSSTLNNVQFYGITRSLQISDVPNLSNLVLAGVDTTEIKTFHIGKNVGTNVEGFTVQPIVEGIYSVQKSQSSPRLQSIHIENVNWKDFDVEALSWLADVPTCVLKGTIAIKEDDPQGLPRVTWDLKNKFNAKFGNVDNGNGGLSMNYTRKSFDADNAKIKGNFYVEAGNTFKFEVRPYSIYENTQTVIFYYIAGGGSDYYMITNSGVLTIKNLQNTKKEDEVYAYVAYENKSAKISKTIEIWNRPAQVGDLVYADGTFSSKESYDGEKTVVGRCFYVAPKKNGQVNTKLNDPNDKWLRMMVAADDVYVNNANSHQWGVYPLNSDEAHQNSYSLFYLDDNDVRQNLSIDGIAIANIQTITDITSGGLTKQNEAGEWVGTSYIDDASYRDLTDEGYENDGFRMYAQNTAVGDGFGADTTGRVLDDALAKLAGSGYAKGDIVNSSYAKTLKVIHHRNGIISHVQESGEGINGLYAPLDFPTASGNKTELQHLGDLITAVREWAKGTGQGAPGETVNFNKWSQLLYPAASACYAYEPTNLMDGEVLNPKFKAHNWALPTDGILARLFWYTYDGKGNDTAATPKEGGVLDTVTNPNGKVVFKKITSSGLWSVTEYYSNLSWFVIFGIGTTTYNLKNNDLVGRAVSAF